MRSLSSLAMLILFGCGDSLECGPGTVEVDGACRAVSEGGEGQPCYGNGTCDGDLECQSNVCRAQVFIQGEDGGECYPNSTCNAGLECASGRCRAMTCTPSCTG